MMKRDPQFVIAQVPINRVEEKLRCDEIISISDFVALLIRKNSQVWFAVGGEYDCSSKSHKHGLVMGNRRHNLGFVEFPEHFLLQQLRIGCRVIDSRITFEGTTAGRKGGKHNEGVSLSLLQQLLHIDQIDERLWTIANERGSEFRIVRGDRE